MNKIQIFQLKRAAVILSQLADSTKDLNIRADLRGLASIVVKAVNELDLINEKLPGETPIKDTDNAE
jgi:hypothetical protein